MEVCPKCGSIFIEWDGGNQRFRCLQKDCLHTWRMELKEPVKNVYLRMTLPYNGKQKVLTKCKE